MWYRIGGHKLAPFQCELCQGSTDFSVSAGPVDQINLPFYLFLLIVNILVFLYQACFQLII